MEDQTIEDIDKVEKTTPEKDSNPMRLSAHNLENVETEAQDNEQHGDVDDQPFGSGVEVPIDDAQEEHDDMILVIYLNHLKSNSGGLIDRNNLLQGILVMST